MAEEAECTEYQAYNHQYLQELKAFSSIYALQTQIGWKQNMKPLMIGALCDHLSEKLGFYLHGMTVFPWDANGNRRHGNLKRKFCRQNFHASFRL